MRDTQKSTFAVDLSIYPTHKDSKQDAQTRIHEYVSLLEQRAQLLTERKALLLERQRLLERSQALVLHNKRLVEHKKALLLPIKDPHSTEMAKQLLDPHTLSLVTHQTAVMIFDWLTSVERTEVGSR